MLVAATTNMPVLPTVTVSLAGFVVIDGSEIGGGVGGGVGGRVGVGGGVVGGRGAGDVIGPAFTLPPTLEQPDKNNAGNTKSVRRCKVLAQRGRGFGSRGRGCLIKKNKSS